MDFARKMLLVPEDLSTVASVAEKTVQTPGTVQSRLDAEMRDILESNKDDREKSIAYQQTLQRFLNLASNRQSNLNSEITDMQDNLEAGDEKKNKKIDEEIVNSVPAKFRKKAENFLAFARKINTVTWDHTGRVRLRGILLPDSNIIDLVNDAMRSRKTFVAVGRRQFCSALRAAGLPESFVGNKYFWREGETLEHQNSSSPHSSLASSSHQPMVNTPQASKENKKKDNRSV